MNNKIRISNIQRFSLHDGPGIRTTVFLKGCNLRCPWCANPENLEYEFTTYKNEETKENGYFGKDMNVEELFNEIIKDKPYYQLNNGGVTFSGGEPLLQAKQLEPLLKKLKENDINICVETALQVPSQLIEIVEEYIDEFIVDIKILNKEKCKEILNGDIEIYMNNIKSLVSKNKIKTFRIPLVKEYTMKKENIEQILKLLKKYHTIKVEIFKIHNLAESKYRAIGKEIPNFSTIDDNSVKEVYKQIKEMNIDVEIIKI